MAIAGGRRKPAIYSAFLDPFGIKGGMPTAGRQQEDRRQRPLGAQAREPTVKGPCGTPGQGDTKRAGVESLDVETPGEQSAWSHDEDEGGEFVVQDPAQHAQAQVSLRR
jgi:hypothetical protein